MKNRSVLQRFGMLCTAGWLVLAAGCGGNKGAQTGETTQEPTTEQTDSAASASSEAASAQTTQQEAQTPAPAAAETGEILVKDYEQLLPGYQTLHYIDAAGELHLLRDFGPKETIVYTDVCDTCIAVVTSITKGAETNYSLYLLDPHGELLSQTGLYRREEQGSFWTPDSFGLIDGRFCYSLYGDTEVIYTYDLEGDAIIEDTDLTRAQQLIRQQAIDNGRYPLVYSWTMPAPLSRYGGIYLRSEDQNTIITYDRAGDQVAAWAPPVAAGWYEPLQSGSLAGYQYNYDETEGGSYRYFVYDVAGKQMRELTLGHSDTQNNTNSTLLEVDGETVYYLVNQGSSNGGLSDQTLYRRLPDGSEQELCTLTWPLSFYENNTDSYSRNLLPGRIHFCRDALYVLLYQEGTGFIWNKISLDTDTKLASTGICDSDVDYAAYGTLTAQEDHRYTGDDDNICFFNGTYETFRIKDSLPYAASVNRVLDQFYAEVRSHGNDIADDAAAEISDPDNGAWMRESGIAYSYDFRLRRVEEPADGYLQLIFDAYDFYGGAHGMPTQQILLFDEATGERRTITDFFPGTKEELTAIIVDYTMEAWKKGDQRFYEDYDPARESDQRADFTESARMDLDVTYGEEGITVDYPPYAVGPYASGFIDVFIPYGALGFSLSGLTGLPEGDAHMYEPGRRGGYWVIECPPWDAPEAEPTEPLPIKLTEIGQERSDWLNTAEWSDRTGIALPDTMYGGAYGPGEIHEGGYIFELDTSEEKRLLALSVYTEKYEWLGRFDFSQYLNTPAPGNQFTTMEIPYAAVAEGTLYVELAHRTYSADQPYTGYIVAVDLATGALRWRSRTLVANGHNFLVWRDVIICGYGFTDEDDYLYILSRDNGAVLQQTGLRTGPDYFINTGDHLHVLTYNTAYEYQVEDQ
ncbi:MAG: DUF3298 domain-containing protein [Butyrivibrio sp.]|nr:DUF3298 domain-containing protein [Butyrivibrio sp.]